MIKMILNPLRKSNEVRSIIENEAPFLHTLLQATEGAAGTMAPLLLYYLSTGKLILNEVQLMRYKSDFIKHYKPWSEAVGFADPIVTPWSELERLAQESGINLDQLAMYFIHRYDAGTDKWFLTVECCELGIPGADVIGGTLYPLSHSGIFFDMKGGAITPTSIGDLEDDPSGYKYGPDYYEAIAYSANTTDFDSMTMHNTRACIFPWFELYLVYKHNCEDRGRDAAQFALSFGCISSNYSGVIPAQSLVAFPHGISIHAKYNDGDLLNNGDVIAGSYFEDKAGDFQTLCPPQCSTYMWPDDLSALIAALPKATQ